MKPPPGQLSLFKLDAREEPLVQQAEAPQARPAPVKSRRSRTAVANHDDSPGPATRNGDDPLAVLAGYLTQLAAAPAVRVPTEAELR